MADQSGSYRIEVRTFFKPTSPGRYRVSLKPPDKIDLVGQSCEEKSWLDREDKFLVDQVLKSITECMSAVARKLGPKHPEAATLASETSSQVNFLVSRWRWGEFVSAAYQEILTLDFRMLGTAAKEADEKRAVAILREVADDVRIKADHCRNSTRGLGKDVIVQVETRKGENDRPGLAGILQIQDLSIQREIYSPALSEAEQPNPVRIASRQISDMGGEDGWAQAVKEQRGHCHGR